VPELVVPIFPLPELTFFPHTVLPLHVFEARYRAMVTDALARERRLAIVHLKPGFEADYAGKPAVHAVAGAGQIVNAERLTTGRFNIVVRGDMRIRIIRELPADTIYRLVLAERLDDVDAAGDVKPVIERIHATCRRLLETVGRPVDLLDGAFGENLAPGAIADRIASAVLPSAARRQELLETLEVDDRLTRLADALDDLVSDLKKGRRE
jgi:Lon protease-like protein